MCAGAHVSAWVCVCVYVRVWETDIEQRGLFSYPVPALRYASQRGLFSYPAPLLKYASQRGLITKYLCQSLPHSEGCLQSTHRWQIPWPWHCGSAVPPLPAGPQRIHLEMCAPPPHVCRPGGHEGSKSDHSHWLLIWNEPQFHSDCGGERCWGWQSGHQPTTWYGYCNTSCTTWYGYCNTSCSTCCHFTTKSRDWELNSL